MTWTLEYAGWTVAFFSMVANVFQWVTTHYQTEKGFRKRDEELTNKAWSNAVKPVHEYFTVLAFSSWEKHIVNTPDENGKDIMWLTQIAPTDLREEFSELYRDYISAQMILQFIHDADNRKGLEQIINSEFLTAREKECKKAAAKLTQWLAKSTLSQSGE
jgi:hypothetical protein